LDDHKVDLTDEKKADCKVSKLVEWTELHWADLRVVLTVFQSVVLTDEKWTGLKVSKRVGWMDSQWDDLMAVRLVDLMA
jgi:uncharacterized protein with PIN domain